ncbi:hypothetical protein [Lysinibacillus pakistanensis]|uniref:Uncharacterized protein n=1 Tax=Lysinibacillus pakistanensis TaxID=759811 RepID=A0AAX3WRE8_9BACI|nr:hypothetical protein [Lysinibacillus pakistanensis]WHY45281.1 hypothetical protein QNH22_18460 [Lysinibacillus pakistanensis]WHY50289.1 hypothetical protein QNH24_18425 [Lysinibacillus pakistanensis]
MRIGYTHADVYDRESEYWQDIEDAQNAQIEAQKNSSKAATDGEQDKNLIQPKITGIVPQEEL